MYRMRTSWSSIASAANSPAVDGGGRNRSYMSYMAYMFH